MGQGQDARRNHQRWMGQQTPETKSRPTPQRLRQTMQPMRTTHAPRPSPTPRPRRLRPNQVQGLQPPGMQPARRRPQSTSNTALRQTNQDSAPLVRRAFRCRNPMTCTSGDIHSRHQEVTLTRRFGQPMGVPRGERNAEGQVTSVPPEEKRRLTSFRLPQPPVPPIDRVRIPARVPLQEMPAQRGHFLLHR